MSCDTPQIFTEVGPDKRDRSEINEIRRLDYNSRIDNMIVMILFKQNQRIEIWEKSKLRCTRIIVVS